MYTDVADGIRQPSSYKSIRRIAFISMKIIICIFYFRLTFYMTVRNIFVGNWSDELVFNKSFLFHIFHKPTETIILFIG